MGVEHGVGFARDRRALRIADRQNLRALLTRVTHGHQRVHCFAALRDRDDERARADDWIAVAEFTRELYLTWHARPVLKCVLSDHARVIRGATGDNDDLVDLAKLFFAQTHLVELQLALRINAST